MDNVPKYFFDTCSLLNFYESIFKSTDHFVISEITLRELEFIKTSYNKSDEVKYKARQVTKLLIQNQDKYDVILMSDEIYNRLEVMELDDTPDNRIVMTATYYYESVFPVTFVTDDLCLYNIAKQTTPIPVKLGSEVFEDKQDSYKGYTLLKGDSDYINDYINNINYSKWYINQYLIIENTDDSKTTEMRYNGETFVPLKLPPSNYIKGKNALQRCALDLMLNKDITIGAILGGYGSGKTYLATQMALYDVTEKGYQSKVVGIRECSGEGKEIGFLKGTFEDKTGKFFKPLEQQLKGGEFELDSLIQRGVLETNIPFYLKGTTYNSTVMLVDEAEDLTESQIRLIGTRLGENSKIYFAGDYNQSLLNKTLNNPLVKMCNELKGNPMFGCVVLDEDVRSNTSKVFANLFKM